MLVLAPAFAADPRLSALGADDPGPASIVWVEAMWHRFREADGAILHATAADGARWSGEAEVLRDVTDPSVVVVDGVWTMAVSLPTDPPSVGRATSADGLEWSLDETPWYTCAGDCGRPTLQHIGVYWILNHAEHTATFDGMRVHHSEDGETWSSGITHESPDGADRLEILYDDDGWLLASTVGDTLTVWRADQIEGDKEVIATGTGPAAFYRDASGARIKGSTATWLGGATRATLALLDGEAPNSAVSCADDPPADGPAGDDGFTLSDGCVVTLGDVDAAGVDRLRIVAGGTGSIDVQWGDEHDTVAVDGETDLALEGAPGGPLTLTAHGAVTLRHVAAEGTTAWRPDTKDTGTSAPEACGCTTGGASPTLLGGLVLARRRRRTR